MTREAAMHREAIEMARDIDAHHASARALLHRDGPSYRAAIVKAQASGRAVRIVT